MSKRRRRKAKSSSEGPQHITDERSTPIGDVCAHLRVGPKIGLRSIVGDVSKKELMELVHEVIEGKLLMNNIRYFVGSIILFIISH